jgi:hypothetical protein
MNEEQVPTITHPLCPGERVVSIRLTKDNKEADPPVWEIEAPDGSSIETVELGNVPPDFVEKIPLVDSLSESQRFIVVYESSFPQIGRVTTTAHFVVADLRSGVLADSDGNVISHEDLERLRRCPN